MSKKNARVLMAVSALMIPALWSAGAGVALAGTPRTFNSTVTHTGPLGNTVTKQSSVTTNGHGGFSSNTTWTGPKGNTATRQQTGSYDAVTKTYTSSGTFTGPAGKQSTFNTTVQGTGNGYTRNTTVTGPDGKTTTINGQGAYNSATGTFNQSRTTTLPNGQSATENRNVTVSPAQPQGN
jgi:hypothetical protein